MHVCFKDSIEHASTFCQLQKRRDHGKDCVHCKMEEDNTEHLVECRQLGETILKKEDIADDGNPELWKLMTERIKYNLNTRGNKNLEEK